MRSMIQILHILEIQHNHRILNGLLTLLCIISNPSKCIQTIMLPGDWIVTEIMVGSEITKTSTWQSHRSSSYQLAKKMFGNDQKD